METIDIEINDAELGNIDGEDIDQTISSYNEITGAESNDTIK